MFTYRQYTVFCRFCAKGIRKTNIARHCNDRHNGKYASCLKKGQRPKEHPHVANWRELIWKPEPVDLKVEKGVDYYASASDTEELKVEDNAHQV